ncbi:cytokine SCM-1 beta [Chelonia mydas]|uniref:cytokine SCM-1 beta n=1 Tax=Chelonia mydas TaxID=8469 RepID=UPI0018A23FE7|nr:cytokine SCM-1 beta [Chelonia mydas]
MTPLSLSSGSELTIARYISSVKGAPIIIFSSATPRKPSTMKLHGTDILVIFCLGLFTVSTVRGSVASQIAPRSSCVDLSTQQLDIRRLVKYENQNIPVKAVMFITKRGIKICVQPDLKWVQDAIRFLDKGPVPRRPNKKPKSKPKPKAKPNGN